PNDNDIAISNDSMIVSVTNSRVHVYNSVTEELIRYRSLGNLAIPLSISGNKFDPKVVYDPVSDRFVIVYLNGFTWGTSWIIVGFSQTNDPSGDWNMYKIYGNPLGNETWSDYPVIGISQNDLFIGVNTFTNGSVNNSGFTESCLWQVGLSEGYTGNELITNYYSDILPGTNKIFNITPIGGGIEPYGPNMYFLSNRTSDEMNDTLFLLEVTGPVTDQNTELTIKTLQADQPYVLPIPARQANGHWFDTNDNRVLGGYYHNGSIQYVQSCTDTLTGTTAVYHGTITNPTQTEPLASSRIISEPDLNYGYPNISCSGLTETDEQAIITFNHSSESVYAGFSAIYLTGAMEASDRVLIKAGLSLVNVLSDSIERWGDYSGSQPVYDELGTIWAAGSFGNGSNGHGTWLSKLSTPDMSADVEDISDEIHTNFYPNPFTERLTIEFELETATFMRLELYDMQGRLVRLLLEDRIKAGKNRLSFNDEFLNSGTYLLKGSSDKETVIIQKLLKN
ncbi:MAG: T9SS type A sorting domain-containing protein, partial [Flavobacteriales bacterium]|nr:T9SS type A sorting domain-containing protein [Flavobacteriales bacterium]